MTDFEGALAALLNEVAVSQARQLLADEPQKVARLDECVSWANRLRFARSELEANKRAIAELTIRH